MGLLCSKCKATKPEEEFWPADNKARGRSYWCKECNRKRNTEAARKLRERQAVPCVKGCGAKVKPTCKTGMCSLCFNKSRTGGESPLKGTGKRYVSIKVDGKVIGEHRYVMQQILGRDLLPGENVHHKNGVRKDNRPENLELWVTHQPAGQRPEDLLAWAYEIIRRYGT